MAKDKKSQLPPDGLRPPRLQELRPAREDHQGGLRRDPRRARHPRPAPRHRPAARGGGAHRPVLHRAQALPERRLLQRHHLPRDRHPHQHVHGDVRPRPPAGLDRPLEGDDRDRAPKIGRPRQIYTGPTETNYVPIEQRKAAAEDILVHERSRRAAPFGHGQERPLGVEAFHAARALQGAARRPLSPRVRDVRARFPGASRARARAGSADRRARARSRATSTRSRPGTTRSGSRTPSSSCR